MGSAARRAPLCFGGGALGMRFRRSRAFAPVLGVLVEVPAILTVEDSPASRANRLEARLASQVPTWAAPEAARTGEKAADREKPGEEDFSQDPEDYSNRGGDNE